MRKERPVITKYGSGGVPLELTRGDKTYRAIVIDGIVTGWRLKTEAAPVGDDDPEFPPDLDELLTADQLLVNQLTKLGGWPSAVFSEPSEENE